MENNYQENAQPETEEMTVKGFVKGLDLNRYTKPNKEWLIKDYLPRGVYYGSMYGASGSGKSFIALDMQLHIASGLALWHGIKCEQAKVAYLTKEGNSSIPTRVKCWADYHKADYKQIRENFFVLSPDRNYTSIVMNQGTQEYKDLIAELKEKGPFGLVTLDTFMEFFDGDDENGSVEMQEFNIAVKNFAKELKTNVFVIHHCGKWNIKEAKEDPYFLVPDGRGSSALKGALDYQFGVGGRIKSKYGAKLMITKTKDGNLEGEESEIYFYGNKYELTDLGTDKYGEYESSLVIERGGESKKLYYQTRNDKETIESLIEEGLIKVEYRLKLPNGPKMLPFITSDDLKDNITEIIGEASKKEISNQLNPKQEGRLIARLIQAGLIDAEKIGRGSYRYYIQDNPVYEDNNGIWKLPDPDKNPSKEVTKVTQ